MDWIVKFKGESRKVEGKNVENELQLLVHNSSAFETLTALNNLPTWRSVGTFIKLGKGIISFKVFIGYKKLSVKNLFLKVKVLDVA